MSNRLLGEKRKFIRSFDGALALLLGLGVVIVLSLILAVPALFVPKDSVWYVIINTAPLQFGLIGLYLVFMRKAKIDYFASVGLKKPPTLAGLLIPPVVFVCIFATLLACTAYADLLSLTGYVTPGTADGTAVLDNLTANNAGEVVLYTVGIALLPAFGEELLFRGLLLNGTKKIGTVFAVLLNGALFALYHMNPDQLIHQFVLGVVLAYFVLRTGSLWVGIIGHFSNNAIALIFEFTRFDFELAIPDRAVYALAVPVVLLFLAGVTLLADAVTGNIRNNLFVRLFRGQKRGGAAAARADTGGAAFVGRDANDLRYRAEYDAAVGELYAKKTWVPLPPHNTADPVSVTEAREAADAEYNHRVAAQIRSKRTLAIVILAVTAGAYALMWLIAFVMGVMEGAGITVPGL
ncbi:MAG: CPBP family intramembrane metalloprotease [Clostridiales bacterium]|jgi:membrane protease YdiL (CAAX protease family)|nr:CPBP family intramembrane metalloprotease [Clostridiales bacterium]